MKTLSFLLPIICVIVFACNNTQNSNQTSDSITNATKLDNDARQFIVDVLNSGAMEVEMGKLAQSQALNPRVKAFGTMMINDHTKAADELKVIAAKKNIITAQIMEGDHLKDIEELKKENGLDFDKKYLKMMLSTHRKDIKKFKDIANDNGDATLKAFAAKTLPKLEMHLDSAKSINKEIKASLDSNDIGGVMEKYPIP